MLFIQLYTYSKIAIDMELFNQSDWYKIGKW